MTIGATAAVMLLAVGLGACGGSSGGASDAAQVEQVIHDYLARQAGGDATGACALVSAAGQRELVAFVERQARSRSLPAGGLDCPRAIDLVRVVAGAQTLAALKAARVSDVHAAGTRATAVIRDGALARRAVVQLEKTNGGWKIRAVPAIGG